MIKIFLWYPPHPRCLLQLDTRSLLPPLYTFRVVRIRLDLLERVGEVFVENFGKLSFELVVRHEFLSYAEVFDEKGEAEAGVEGSREGLRSNISTHSYHLSKQELAGENSEGKGTGWK